MTILGAIFAGGQSRRYGSDKALAAIDGIAMLDRIAAQLAPQCDALVVVGREWPGLDSVADLPHAGLGPLGALAGALHHALEAGHEQVLTTGCDLPDIPADLVERLQPAPAVLSGQPLLGLWNAAMAETLIAYLGETQDRSMRGWIEQVNARLVPPPCALVNINSPEDMAAYRGRIA